MLKNKLVERIPMEGFKNCTHIDVMVRYNKGGVNFNGGFTPRGYYANVTTVTKKDGMVSCNIFSGESRLLMQTKRYSDKQFAEAVEMSKSVTPYMVARIIEREKAA